MSEGLDAIEVYHSEHDSAATSRYLAMAASMGIAVSGGSDYHGDPTHGPAQPGAVCLPREAYDALVRLRDDPGDGLGCLDFLVEQHVEAREPAGELARLQQVIGRRRPASVPPLIHGEGFVHNHTARRLHGLSNRWKQIALQVARDEHDIERPGRQSPRGQIGAPSTDDQTLGTRAGRRFAHRASRTSTPNVRNPARASRRA